MLDDADILTARTLINALITFSLFRTKLEVSFDNIINWKKFQKQASFSKLSILIIYFLEMAFSKLTDSVVGKTPINVIRILKCHCQYR